MGGREGGRKGGREEGRKGGRGWKGGRNDSTCAVTDSLLVSVLLRLLRFGTCVIFVVCKPFQVALCSQDPMLSRASTSTPRHTAF